MASILALRTQKQADLEFQVSLVYINLVYRVSSKTPGLRRETLYPETKR